MIELDPPRIQQVLSNLIGNAVKYSPEGTVVVVRLELSDEEAAISVIDQGPGIPKQAQGQLFERYFQGSAPSRVAAEGLGLGLYVAHGIVAAHHGRMWVESEVGVGSTFGFALPLTQPEAGAAE
jgi:signal transduction histidine kinase